MNVSGRWPDQWEKTVAPLGMLLTRRSEAELRSAGYRRVADAREGEDLAVRGLHLLLCPPPWAVSSTAVFRLAYVHWPVFVSQRSEELAEALGFVRGRRDLRWTDAGLLLEAAQDRGDEFLEAAVASAALGGEPALRALLDGVAAPKSPPG